MTTNDDLKASQAILWIIVIVLVAVTVVQHFTNVNINRSISNMVDAWESQMGFNESTLNIFDDISVIYDVVGGNQKAILNIYHHIEWLYGAHGIDYRSIGE